jgi:flagellar export protein FliJ
MSAFRFRLATLLRLREAARDERRGQLAEAVQLDQRVRGQVQQVRGAIDASKQTRRQAVGGSSLDVDRLLAAARHELALEGEEQVYLRQLEAIGVELERRRQALVEADREVRTLERLRETHQERHVREELRSEQKVLDELALAPFVRGEAS